MAEKEERIAVAKMLVNTDDEGSAKLDHFKIYSRPEAINRMAKALCMKEMFGCERCTYGKNKDKCEAWVAFSYMNGAEAALNALLDR